jgi:hypothetical protein
LLPDIGRGNGDTIKRVSELSQIGAAFSGERYAAMVAPKELHAQKHFQRSKLMAYGGWSHIQFVRGVLETEMARSGLECAHSEKRRELSVHRG